MAPRITAVLNSYLRVQYLWEALASILHQDSDRPLDVVLLSAIPGLEVPEGLRRLAEERAHSLRVVPIPPGPVGVGLSTGATAARGDYLALLDDDDLWVPGKIRAIERAVGECPELGYFHNAQTFIGPSGRALGPWSPHRLVRHPSSLRRPGSTLVVNPRDGESVRRGLDFAPDFNNSSLVVRRDELLAPRIPLREVRRGEDTFLWYVFLGARRPIYLTSDRWTKYRLHGAASTAGSAAGGRVSDPFAGYVALARGHVESLELIREHLLRDCEPVVADWLASDMAFWETMAATASGAGPTADARTRLRQLLGKGVRPRSKEVFGWGWGVGAHFAPRTTRAAFRAWRHAW